MKMFLLFFSSGPEGALFQHSVEVPVLRSELFKDLKWVIPPLAQFCRLILNVRQKQICASLVQQSTNAGELGELTTVKDILNFNLFVLSHLRELHSFILDFDFFVTF